MSNTSDPRVSKLLRVLVAGGMALAGVAGTRADDQSPATATEQAGKGAAADERQDKSDAQENAKKEKDEKKTEDEKKASEQKAADSSGGGVKGW